jgi:hypothetical protein
MVATREHVISKRADLKVFLDSHPLHRFYGGENAYLLEEYLSAIRSAGLKLKDVMGPLDSPINYFPMTASQHFALCTRPVVARIGSTAARLLVSPRGFFGRWLTKILASRLSQRDQTPGRLYSFVAVKPRA